MSFAERDGFTVNDLTGNDIDSRSAFAAKGQVLWKPSAAWETRVIVSGERARDGDYALNDLAAVRQNPFEVARDYEGQTDRDIFSTTILAQARGQQLHVLQHDRLREVEHVRLHRSRLLAVAARDAQQHRRGLPVHPGSPPRVGGRLAGEDVRRDVAALAERACSSSRRATTNSSCRTSPPFVIPRRAGSRAATSSPDATLDDVGFGVYGQGTLSFKKQVDFSFGARVDHESKDADISTSTHPPLGPPTTVQASRSFTDVSPQFGVVVPLQRRRRWRTCRSIAATRRAASTRGRHSRQRGLRRRARVARRGRGEDVGGARAGVVRGLGVLDRLG